MAKNFKPLGKKEQEFIAELIGHLVPVAKDEAHVMSKFARHQISNYLFHWTADFINEENNKAEVSDASKYNLGCIAATGDAIQKIKSGKGRITGIRHEHAVPRKELVTRIIEKSMDKTQILSFLKNYCFAVLVTVAQDRSLKRKFPAGWEWEQSNPLARYAESGLSVKLPPN